MDTSKATPDQLVRQALDPSQTDTTQTRRTISDFATKFNFKEVQFVSQIPTKLLRMYDNPNNIPVMFRKIIRAKLERGFVIPEENRVLLYRTLGLANYWRRNHPNYYQKLLAMNKYPNYFESTIEKDVLRSTPSLDEGGPAKIRFQNKLRNILLALCRRNPQIGYCQGFNYIVAFLIELKMEEDDVFYVARYLLEEVIPTDYYNNMTGVLSDDALLNILLSIRLPKILDKLDELGVQTSVFSIQWLVCLFTFSGFNKAIVAVIMDNLLVFGSDVLLRACMVHLELIEPQLLDTSDLGCFLKTLEKHQQLYSQQRDFSEKLQQFKINKKTLNRARDIVRSKILNDRLASDAKFMPKRFQHQLLTLRCNPNFPICLYVKERAKLDKEYFDHLVFRADRFYVNTEYMDGGASSQCEEPLLIGRDEHKCPQLGLDLSESNLLDEQHATVNDMKYVSYLNVNDHIDYARQSYAVLSEQPQRSTPNSNPQQRSTSNSHRSPFKDLLLLPLKFLEKTKPKADLIDRSLITIRERDSTSPRFTSGRKVWKPSQNSSRMKYKSGRVQSPSFNSTQSQSTTSEILKHKVEEVTQFTTMMFNSMQEETQKLKKLSIIIGQDEVSKL